MGRRSTFTREAADAVCEKLADGESLRSACRDEAMPSERCVRNWVVDNAGVTKGTKEGDANHYEGFAAQYARAREVGYLKMADELTDIADDGSNDWLERELESGRVIEVANHEHINRSRLRVDTRKWVLSKMLPKIYGDKVTTVVQNPDGSPMQPTMAILTPADGARAYQDMLKQTFEPPRE
jgi:hypothetical protein